MGVERIGDESADADAELLAMTVECLLAAGLTEFQVSVGQVDYFKSLLKEAELGPEAEERLRVLISQKNSFGVEEFVEEQKLKDSMQKAFTEIPQMFGSEEVLKKARSLTNNACALEAVSRLEEIYEIMKTTDMKSISLSILECLVNISTIQVSFSRHILTEPVNL